ncbi:MAG: hypothetical protein JJU35_07595 [Balneolales bacterium]|nr:hypothetical protein [Balneolales bacterium]
MRVALFKVILLSAILLAVPAFASPAFLPDYLVTNQQSPQPRNVQQAVITLAAELSEETRARYLAMEEEAFVGYGIGQSELGSSLIGRWELGGYNPLTNFFTSEGLRTPPEMAEVILTSLHRYLNGRPMQLQDQLREMRAFWEGESQ